jgi:hypothetical protein
MEKIGLTYQGTRPYRGREAAWYALDRATWERSHQPVDAAIVNDHAARYASEPLNRGVS